MNSVMKTGDKITMDHELKGFRNYPENYDLYPMIYDSFTFLDGDDGGGEPGVSDWKFFLGVDEPPKECEDEDAHDWPFVITQRNIYIKEMDPTECVYIGKVKIHYGEVYYPDSQLDCYRSPGVFRNRMSLTVGVFMPWTENGWYRKPFYAVLEG